MTEPGAIAQAEPWAAYLGAAGSSALEAHRWTAAAQPLGPSNPLLPTPLLQAGLAAIPSASPYRTTQRTTQSADLPMGARGPPAHHLPRVTASVRSYSDCLDLLYTQQGQLASQLSSQEDPYATEAGGGGAPWAPLYGGASYRVAPTTNHAPTYSPLPPLPSGIDLVSLLLQYNAPIPEPAAGTQPADRESWAPADPSPSFSASPAEPLHSLVVTLLEDYLAGTAGRAPGSLHPPEVQALRRGLAIVEGTIGERLRAAQARRSHDAPPPQYHSVHAQPFYPDGGPTWHPQPAPPPRAGGGAALPPAAPYMDTFTSAPAVLRPFEFATTYHRAGGDGASTPDLFASLMAMQRPEGHGEVGEPPVGPGPGYGQGGVPWPQAQSQAPSDF